MVKSQFWWNFGTFFSDGGFNSEGTFITKKIVYEEK